MEGRAGEPIASERPQQDGSQPREAVRARLKPLKARDKRRLRGCLETPLGDALGPAFLAGVCGLSRSTPASAGPAADP